MPDAELNSARRLSKSGSDNEIAIRDGARARANSIPECLLSNAFVCDLKAGHICNGTGERLHGSQHQCRTPGRIRVINDEPTSTSPSINTTKKTEFTLEVPRSLVPGYEVEGSIPFWQSLADDLNVQNAQRQSKIELLQEKIVTNEYEIFRRDNKILQQQRDLENRKKIPQNHAAEISKLKMELNKAKEDLNQARGRMAEMQPYHAPTSLHAHAGGFKHQESFVDKERARLSSELDIANIEIKQMRSKTARLQDKYDRVCKECEQEVSQLNGELAMERKKADHTTREINKLQSSFRTIQEKKFSTIESAHWMPQATSDIDRKINHILSDIKQWSRRNAADSLPNFDLVINLLRSRGALIGPLDALRSVYLRKKPGTHLFLSAAVAASAFSLILGDPFFAFKEENAEEAAFRMDHDFGPKGRSLRKEDSQGVRNLVNLIANSDESGANAWRSQLLRLLYPPPSSTSNASAELRTVVTSCRHQAAQSLAKYSVEDLAVLLKQEKVETSMSEVQEIFEDCAEFGWSLWIQKTRIKILDMDSIRWAPGEKEDLRYSHQSNYLDSHAQHNRDLDRSESALDGKPVLLLTSPAVVAVGTIDGTDYDQERVWKKGVVWMG